MSVLFLLLVIFDLLVWHLSEGVLCAVLEAVGGRHFSVLDGVHVEVVGAAAGAGALHVGHHGAEEGNVAPVSRVRFVLGIQNLDHLIQIAGYGTFQLGSLKNKFKKITIAKFPQMK